MKYFTSLLLVWCLTIGSSQSYVESNVLISNKIEINVSECSAERAKAYKTLEEELLKVQFSLDLSNSTLIIQSDVGKRKFDLNFETTSKLVMTDDAGTRVLANWHSDKEVKTLEFKEDPSNCFAYLVYF